MDKFNCKVEVRFCGDKSKLEAFVYELKSLNSNWDIVINDSKDCWDIIMYNRFFGDGEDEDLIINDEVLVR
jgi:hypothetical protein